MNIRKYLSEFGINMATSQTIILQQHHLESLTEKDFDQNNKCHIYMIAQRPKITLDLQNTKFTPSSIDFTFNALEEERKIPFSFKLANNSYNPALNCNCKYPFTDFQFLDSKNNVVLEGSAAQFLVSLKNSIQYWEKLDLDILYIGQAFGKDGDRMAPQRLTTHETLQEIYSDAHRKSPDKDIWLILLSFKENLLASFDGRSGAYETGDKEDLEHMKKVLETPISEAHLINYTEAALIRYFQPSYNTTFKKTFPSSSHLSYSECYDLDINSVVVELDLNDINCRIFSKSVVPNFQHVINFQLLSKDQR